MKITAEYLKGAIDTLILINEEISYKEEKEITTHVEESGDVLVVSIFWNSAWECIKKEFIIETNIINVSNNSANFETTIEKIEAEIEKIAKREYDDYYISKYDKKELEYERD